MRVLVTGGCGFIGSHIADRFHAAGSEVSIIDNLSTGAVDNIKDEYRLYRLDIQDAECERVFAESRPDIVVHMAAQADVNTSINNPVLDAASNILGLVNMLHLSCRYGAGKFIFASSAAVYGNSEQVPLREEMNANPLSPYGISKLTGELYCMKWKEIFGLNTLCFRFSNVYGPRQGIKGEGGVVSIFMERLVRNQELVVFGDGTQTRDFIYVEDLAQAVYKSSLGHISGVFNLSTNTETSINCLIKTLETIRPVKNVVYKEQRKGDILKSRLDNSRIRMVLGWDMEYSFIDGVKKTFEYFYRTVV